MTLTITEADRNMYKDKKNQENKRNHQRPVRPSALERSEPEGVGCRWIS